MLIKYREEYIKKIKDKNLSGICIHEWKNFNSFIILLNKIIEENKNIIKKNKILIKKNITSWSKSQKKIKVWQYLDSFYQKKIQKIKRIKQQAIDDNYIKLKFLTKGRVL